MYNAINIGIHLIGVLLIIYACIPDYTYRNGDLTLQKIALYAAVAMLCFWAILVGEAYNIERLISLFFTPK